MSTLLHSPLLGIRITLVAPGKYVCELTKLFDSKLFNSATEAAIWGLSNC
jgi:hypothetical protein